MMLRGGRAKSDKKKNKSSKAKQGLLIVAVGARPAFFLLPALARQR